jgi:hypothetical protein
LLWKGVSRGVWNRLSNWRREKFVVVRKCLELIRMLRPSERVQCFFT